MNKIHLLFVLLLCLICSNTFAQNIIQVAAGTDGITAAYAAAVSGDIIELTTDGGLYIETVALAVDKVITIRAAAGLTNKPTWACTAVDAYGGIFKVYASASVDGIILDGKASTPYTVNGIIAKGIAGGYNITLNNCILKNFTTGLYGSSSAQIDSLKISNTTFQTLASYGVIIYTCDATITAPGSAKYVSITNSTFTNIGLLAIQVEAKDDVLGTLMGDDPVVTLDHCTFYNTQRVLTHYCNYTTISNCIFANPATGQNSYYIYGAQSTCSNSLYWNAATSLHTAVATGMINADPLFVNAPGGDLTIPVSSPAYNAGTDGKTLGDSKWWAGVTPVELSTFTAAVNTREIKLKWETKTEINTNSFEIERSSDAKSWAKISELRGAGNSNSPIHYSYTDKAVQNGIYQYRLRMVDNDGTFKYSPVVEAQIQVPTEFAVSQNYPNPFNPSTRVDYQLPFDSKVCIEIYSISGKKIATILNENQAAGYYTSNINTASMNLGSGVYVYRISAVGNSGTSFIQSKKLVLLK